MQSEFQNQFADSTATGEDFKMVAQSVTGMDFEQFFDQWYYGQGYPRYSIEWYMTGTGIHFDVTQTTSSTTPLFKMTLDYKLTFSDGTNTIVRLYQDNNFNQFDVPVDKQVVSVSVDPNNWTFEKVNSIVVSVPQQDNPAFFTFGPNPAQNHLNIYMGGTENKSYEVIVSDLSGKTILKEHFNSLQHQLNLENISTGAYLLQLSDGSQHFTRRLIK